MPTTRLGLNQPVGFDFVDPVASISDQMGILDNKLLTVICTSGTRPGPSDRFVGMEIYETDTHKLYFWTGTVWQFISDGTTTPPGSSNVRGRQAFEIGNWNTNYDVEPGQEAGPIQTVQLNLLKGRKYRFYVGWNVLPVDANQFLVATLNLRGGEGAAVSSSSPLLYGGCSDYYGNNTGFNINHHLVTTVELPGVGITQHTFGTFLFRPFDTSPGGMNFQNALGVYQYIAIEDVGGI